MIWYESNLCLRVWTKLILIESISWCINSVVCKVTGQGDIHRCSQSVCSMSSSKSCSSWCISEAWGCILILILILISQGLRRKTIQEWEWTVVHDRGWPDNDLWSSTEVEQRPWQKQWWVCTHVLLRLLQINLILAIASLWCDPGEKN